MPTRLPWLLILCLAGAAGAPAFGCTDPLEEDATESGSGGPEFGVPPTLDTEHPGWTRPDCGACHALPVEGHTVTKTYSCASCHGANGACFPNGFNAEYNDHEPDEDCLSCHEQPARHEIPVSSACQNCHFRELGQRECVEWMPPDPPDEHSYPPVGTAPPLATNLSESCFGFPTTPYSVDHHVEEDWATELVPNDQAIEFSLKDLANESHALSELLKDRPVWLQTGSLSCPIYIGALESTLNPLAEGSNDAGPYADQVHFVHVYTVEAHPQDASSPYSGKGPNSVDGEVPVDQATTYGARKSNAQELVPHLSGNELLLIDDLSPELENDPVWCSYARCASCSILIGRDGYVKEVLPNNQTDLETAKQTLDWFLALEAEAASAQ